MIDILEAKREPFGLIRYGVAPDHPEVKGCTTKFKELLLEDSARVSWYGGVSLGKDVQLDEIISSYDAVVLAIGAQWENRLQVSGEELTTSSKTFTHWMNGAESGPSLSFGAGLGKASKCALVIGNGNVALDIARSLVGDPRRFSGTSIGSSAMNELLSSTIKNVAIVGRRGPLQSSFAAKELREIFSLCYDEKIDLLTNVDVSNEHAPSTRSQSILIEGLAKASLINDLACHWPPLKRKDATGRSLSLFFYLSPTRFIKNGNGTSLIATEVVKNAILPDGSIAVHSKNDPLAFSPLLLPSALVVTCLGYGVGHIPGTESFPRTKPRGPLVHERGCVDERLGLFVSGWTKTGPAGALASTMLDAYETADCIISHLPNLHERKRIINGGWLPGILHRRNISWISYNDWAREDPKTVIKT